MVASGPCSSCRGTTLPGFKPGETVTVAPEHCHGRADRPAPKGVMGGYRCSCPCRFKPHELYAMAQRQRPEAVSERYLELMREAGHVVPRHPDDRSPMLPCQGADESWIPEEWN